MLESTNDRASTLLFPKTRSMVGRGSRRRWQPFANAFWSGSMTVCAAFSNRQSSGARVCSVKKYRPPGFNTRLTSSQAFLTLCTEQRTIVPTTTSTRVVFEGHRLGDALDDVERRVLPLGLGRGQIEEGRVRLDGAHALRLRPIVLQIRRAADADFHDVVVFLDVGEELGLEPVRKYAVEQASRRWRGEAPAFDLRTVLNARTSSQPS